VFELNFMGDITIKGIKIRLFFIEDKIILEISISKQKVPF